MNQQRDQVYSLTLATSKQKFDKVIGILKTKLNIHFKTPHSVHYYFQPVLNYLRFANIIDYTLSSIFRKHSSKQVSLFYSCTNKMKSFRIWTIKIVNEFLIKL